MPVLCQFLWRHRYDRRFGRRWNLLSQLGCHWRDSGRHEHDADLKFDAERDAEWLADGDAVSDSVCVADTDGNSRKYRIDARHHADANGGRAESGRYDANCLIDRHAVCNGIAEWHAKRHTEQHTERHLERCQRDGQCDEQRDR